MRLLPNVPHVMCAAPIYSGDLLKLNLNIYFRLLACGLLAIDEEEKKGLTLIFNFDLWNAMKS